MSIPLNQLSYLALDCQSTGNNPINDHLLEIGWCVFNLSENTRQEGCQTFLIRQTENVKLSKRIQKLTGITPAELMQAVVLGDAIDALLRCARDVARQNGTPDCPTVIHFARFEMGFLKHALKQLNMTAGIPLDVICTHKVATRILPQLPRKGLRAVAGYLGHSVSASKRCHAHLQATQWIWRHMVPKLAEQAGIETLDQLQPWLATSPKPDSQKVYPMPVSLRKNVPDGPGIYRMKRVNGDVLYIGKANSLKQRVNSYFHQSRRHPEHILEMLTQAKDLEVTPTATALEAALLESDAIKQANPPYNISLTGPHRELFYLSRNFEKKARVLQKAYPLGPVPSADIFTAARALGSQLLSSDAEADIGTLMAMPAGYCPDRITFNAGLSLFRQTQGHLFNQKPIGHAVLRIGHQSWLQKMEEKNEIDEKDATDAQEMNNKVDFVWTPQAVTNALESICRRCGFLLRRARWFHMVQNSQVVWHKKSGGAKGCHLLTLKRGTVIERKRTSCGEALQPPICAPAVKRTEYRASMDLETYDRLRVLTTEIRRLVAEERLSFIQLGQRARLAPAQLVHLLHWI